MHTHQYRRVYGESWQRFLKRQNCASANMLLTIGGNSPFVTEAAIRKGGGDIEFRLDEFRALRTQYREGSGVKNCEHDRNVWDSLGDGKWAHKRHMLDVGSGDRP